MFETLVARADRLFPDDEILTKEELAQVLKCEPQVIYNWTKRNDPDKRPPRFLLGKELKYPKRDFIKWFVDNQVR